MSRATTQIIRNTKKADLGVRFKKSIPVYLLILPSTALIIIFHYLPIFGIAIAFQDYSVYKLEGFWNKFRLLHCGTIIDRYRALFSRCH